MLWAWYGMVIIYAFFEDGREAFGAKYELEYLDVYGNGYFTPIVKSEINHKAPIYYGDKVKLITKYIHKRAAKLIFEYQIENIQTGVICATGKTIQVFLRAEERTLDLNNPDFFQKWKDKYLTK